MSRFLKRAGLKAQGLLKKGKSAVVAGSALAVATSANAAVSYSEATGALTGSIDMGGYNSALTIIIPAIVTIAVGSIILRTIKKI